MDVHNVMPPAAIVGPHASRRSALRNAIAEHPRSPHPMRIFDDVVADIRPEGSHSYFNLDRAVAA